MIAALEEFREVDGPFLAPFMQRTAEDDQYFVPLKTARDRRDAVDQRTQFARDRDQLITEVMNNIQGRFPQMDLLDAMQVGDCNSVWLFLATSLTGLLVCLGNSKVKRINIFNQMTT